MFKRQFRLLAFVVALLSITGLMVPAVGMAAGPTGMGPGDALAPAGVAQHLNPGQTTWYVFSTAGKDADNSPSNVLVRLHAQPAGSAAFNIWSQGRLQARPAADNPDKDEPPVGQGTIQFTKDGDATVARYGGDLIWSDAFLVPTTYYVEVRQTGAQPSDYTLSITGDAVSFPTAAPQVKLAANTNSARTNSAANQAPLVLPATGQAAAGSQMNTALMATGQTMTLKPGQQQWYRVDVPGTRDDNAHPKVLAELVSTSGNRPNFVVWTPDRLRARDLADNPDRDAPPVGRGMLLQYADGAATLSRYGGDLIWQGDASKAATYYIVVESSGQTPAQYQLHVTTQQ